MLTLEQVPPDGYPRQVMVKNNTFRAFTEQATKTRLAPYSETTLEIHAPGTLERMIKNMRQLNAMNNWEDGLSVELVVTDKPKKPINTKKEGQ